MAVCRWLVEMNNWQGELERRIAPSMHRWIDIDFLWDRAVRQAELDLLAQTRDPAFIARLRALRGTPCPLSFDEVPREPADPAALVKRLDCALRG